MFTYLQYIDNFLELSTATHDSFVGNIVCQRKNFEKWSIFSKIRQKFGCMFIFSRCSSYIKFRQCCACHCAMSGLGASSWGGSFARRASAHHYSQHSPRTSKCHTGTGVFVLLLSSDNCAIIILTLIMWLLIGHISAFACYSVFLVLCFALPYLSFLVGWVTAIAATQCWGYFLCFAFWCFPKSANELAW